MEQVKEKKRETKQIDKDESEGVLIVINDDYNTFIHVISCLKTYCGLNDEEAELCTWKIHNEGRSVILQDKKSVLYPMCENLIESGLTAEIEDKEEK